MNTRTDLILSSPLDLCMNLFDDLFVVILKWARNGFTSLASFPFSRSDWVV